MTALDQQYLWIVSQINLREKNIKLSNQQRTYDYIRRLIDNTKNKYSSVEHQEQIELLYHELELFEIRTAL